MLTHAVVADATDEDVLKSLGIRNFDCAVIAIGDDIQSSILTAIVMKDLGVNQVVAKALSELHGKVLTKLGLIVLFIQNEIWGFVWHINW